MVEQVSSGSSWRNAVRRAAFALRLRRPNQRKPGWSSGVPLIALTAGFLFTVSATTADGTSLREDRRVELKHLIDIRQAQVDQLTLQAKQLSTDVDTATSRLAETDEPIKRERARADALLQAAGMTELSGAGLTVRLDDGAIPDLGPDAVNSENYLIHQQDIQAVVNALWAGGAEAITIMGVRVISTSAVRCVGNTLLLHGRRYSPEFVIQAIGDPARLRQALLVSPSVATFRDAVANYGLGYSVADEASIVAPAFGGTVDMHYAEVPE